MDTKMIKCAVYIFSTESNNANQSSPVAASTVALTIQVRFEIRPNNREATRYSRYTPFQVIFQAHPLLELSFIT